MISTVAFDADDTLVDIHTAVIAGLTEVSAVTGISVDEFQRDAAAFWAATPERAARQIRIQRRRGCIVLVAFLAASFLQGVQPETAASAAVIPKIWRGLATRARREQIATATATATAIAATISGRYDLS